MPSGFSVTSLKKPSGGSGTSTAYSLYQKELGLLDLNRDYVNFLGEVINEEYFEKKKEIMQRALNSSAISAIKKNDIIVDMAALNNAQAKWAYTNDKTFKMTETEINAAIEDNWNSIWKEKDILKTGNVSAMALGVLEADGGIEDMLAQLQEAKSILEEVDGPVDKIDSIQDNIELLEDKRSFWNGVMNKPDNYALLFDTNQDGSIKNMRVKGIQDTSGYKNTGVQMNGFAVFGKSNPNLTDDAGLEKIVIGNNVFTGDANNGFALESGGDFDPATLNNESLYNNMPGSVMKAPNGKYFVMQEDNSFVGYKDQGSLEAAGYSADGATALTDGDVGKIRSRYGVKDSVTINRENEVQDELERVRSEMDQNSTWENLKGYSEDDWKEMGAEAEKQFFKNTTEGAVEIGKGAVKAAEGVGKGVSATSDWIGKTAVSGWKKSGAKIKDTVSDTAKILKGIFGGG